MNEEWLTGTLNMVQDNGWRSTPVYKDGAASPYAAGQNYSDPAQYRDAVAIGLILDDCVLLDWDGNKGDPLPLDGLAARLGLGDMPTPVQENQEGTSLHFLFKLPDDLVVGEHIKHSADGWLPWIDVKCGNSLLHLKVGKIINDGEIPRRDELPTVPPALLDALQARNVHIDPKSIPRWNGSAAECEEAKQILSFLNPNSAYDEWLSVLMGLHSKFGNTTEAMELANEWSKKAHEDRRAPAEVIRYKFSTFDGNGGKTWSSVCHMAQQNGADLSAIARERTDEEQRADAILSLDTGDPSVSPLQKLKCMSVTHRLAEMEADLTDATFVIPSMAMTGSMTLFYSWPNGGKTLFLLTMLTRQMANRAIDPSTVFYINADDNFKGLYHKGKIAEHYGFNMISPQQSGMAPKDAVYLLQELARSGQASGLIIVLDTLKKFTEMLDKKVQSAFFSAMRELTTAGATVLLAGHANKHPDKDGKLVYEGVGDVMNDIDNAYAIYNLSPRAEERQVLKFVNTKDRGDVVMTAQFEYQKTQGQPYVEMMESFREADEKTVNSLVRQRNIAHLRVKHEPAIVMIKAALKTGPKNMSEIVAFARSDANPLKGESSPHAVRKALETEEFIGVEWHRQRVSDKGNALMFKLPRQKFPNGYRDKDDV